MNYKTKTVQVHIIRFNQNEEKYEQLILKRNENAKPYPNVWQVVTGRIEKYETPIETAIREVFEETGIVPVKLWNLPYLASFYNYRENEINFSPVFVFEVYEEAKVNISEEHSDYKWIALCDISKYVMFPSHVIASEYIEKYILSNENNHFYLIDESIWKK
ncbi:MAG TPA: NUDIX domain-containing protein [Candidatus Kapabacteria bacterium]|jgi:dATP pyrophosphohydrolase|nr:NUDIX domain-containing protein [Candidatus Kapabacteria bacterium]HOQ49957.1 NUDIX domain-containing protein [Candidatus Kapabacteria bacterium]HPU24506.1 NUDIX domain-containing protein [Candidatus Kapabacteria bacterium]